MKPSQHKVFASLPAIQQALLWSLSFLPFFYLSSGWSVVPGEEVTCFRATFQPLGHKWLTPLGTKPHG